MSTASICQYIILLNVKKAAYNEPCKISHYIVDWDRRLRERLPGGESSKDFIPIHSYLGIYSIVHFEDLLLKPYLENCHGH